MAASRKARPAPPLTVSSPALLSDGGESDREFRELVHGLLAFAPQIEAIRSGFAAYVGLSAVQYTILISIAHLEPEQAVEVNTIARHLHLSGAFVTIETGKLAARGLVGKRPNPADRRRVLLSVTSAGRELLARLAPIQRQVNDVLFECIPPGELPRALAFVRALIACGDRAQALLDYLAAGGRDRESA
jgi:DNA-binding MarR family transcriptional regulator